MEMEMNLEKVELRRYWPSEAYRKSLLLGLEKINSEIEKADSPPSQSNFEILRDSLLLAVKIIKSGSRDDYWIFIELCYALSLVLVTFSEVDSPPLRKIIEDLQSCSFIKEAILLRKFEYPPLPSHITQANKLYLYFCCSSGPFRYTLFEIELPISDDEIRYPRQPILELKASKYPDGMCCVQLGLQLYFLGGKFEDRTPNVLPQDVYVFNLTLYHKCPHLLRGINEDMLLTGTPMHSGKASPLAFVADAKIYVIGSNLEDLEDEDLEDDRLVYFESYDPRNDQWSVLPNPPILTRYEWVGNAVVRRVAFLLVEMLGESFVFRFNLDTEEWTNKVSVFDISLRNFTGKIEFVGNNLYGCCHNTVVKLAVTEEDLTGGEEEDEFERVARLLFNNTRLRMVSRANGMDVIYNVPRQVQSSTTLLHLGTGTFCFVRTGKPPPQIEIHDGVVGVQDPAGNRDRLTRIVIFHTDPRETDEENMAIFFQAQLFKSKVHEGNSRFGGDEFIKGCYSLWLLL